MHTYTIIGKRDGWRINNKITNARLVKLEKQVSIFYMGSWNFSLIDNLNPRIDEKGAGDKIIAPMPGFIKLVNVQEGEIVRKGDLIIVQEAMKMEHSLIAQKNGQVVKLDVEPGEQVEAGRVLVELGPISERTDV
mgnify:CR=1 FL=1